MIGGIDFLKPEFLNQSLPECDLHAELHFDIVNFVNASYHQVYLGSKSFQVLLLANRSRKGKLTLIKVGPSDELSADGLILGSYVFSPGPFVKKGTFFYKMLIPFGPFLGFFLFSPEILELELTYCIVV